VVTRRVFLLGAGQGALLTALRACEDPGGSVQNQENPAVLTARPGPNGPDGRTMKGTHPLGLEQQRDPLVYVPEGLRADRPAPLLIALHGAGGDAAGGLALLRGLADQYNAVILSPASRGSTWDGIRDGYGPDVDLINRSLEQVFDLVPVDTDMIGIGGFSDGASYALGLGLANGDLFRRVVAFSPGFIPPAPRSGEPAVFISHGTGDTVLPIASTSRRIVPMLEREGYEVVYREFDGPHTVPAGIAAEAAAWLNWHQRS
jgi:phospholipase/carboxylesterase